MPSSLLEAVMNTGSSAHYAKNVQIALRIQGHDQERSGGGLNDRKVLLKIFRHHDNPKNPSGWSNGWNCTVLLIDRYINILFNKTISFLLVLLCTCAAQHTRKNCCLFRAKWLSLQPFMACHSHYILYNAGVDEQRVWR